MFENLRNAFREAVDNFNKELGRDDVPELVDGLLRQMHEEVTDTKAQIAPRVGYVAVDREFAPSAVQQEGGIEARIPASIWSFDINSQ